VQPSAYDGVYASAWHDVGVGAIIGRDDPCSFIFAVSSPPCFLGNRKQLQGHRSTMDTDDRKSLETRQEFVENEEASVHGKLPGLSDELEMPAELAALSEEEYEKVKKSAIWKLDLRIMPPVVLMYILNYLDRQNIASAKLATLVEDLNLSSVQYQTCVSLLFVGYSKFNQMNYELNHARVCGSN
jgi:hypothetical protein